MSTKLRGGARRRTLLETHILSHMGLRTVLQSPKTTLLCSPVDLQHEKLNYETFIIPTSKREVRVPFRFPFELVRK